MRVYHITLLYLGLVVSETGVPLLNCRSKLRLYGVSDVEYSPPIIVGAGVSGDKYKPWPEIGNGRDPSSARYTLSRAVGWLA